VARVAIAIVRDAEPRTRLAHTRREFLRMFAANAVVDIVAVRQPADQLNLRAELPQHHRACRACRAVGCIQNNLPSAQRPRRQQTPDFIQIRRESFRAAQRPALQRDRWLLRQQSLQLCLLRVGQLHAAACKKFDAVVRRDRRRGQHAQRHAVYADRRHPRRNRFEQALARRPRITADQHALHAAAAMGNA
jgi:hypothetical protein